MTRRAGLEALGFTALFSAVVALAVDRDVGAFTLEGWQYLDHAALHGHLGRALTNLHAQPPLLNAVLGVALKLAGPSYALVLHGLGIACVAVNFLLLRGILEQLGLSARFRYALLLLPQVVLYATWFYEPIYCLTFVSLLLHGALSLPSARGLVLVSIACTLLSLTHSIFHPVLMLAFVAVVVLVSGVSYAAVETRALLRVAFLVSLLPCIVLAKNVALFSVPALSSWSGCNLSQTTGGDFGFSDAGFIDDRSRPEIELYRAHKASGVPNYNNLAQIDACKERQHKALAAVRAKPIEYMLRRARALAVGEGAWLATEYTFVARDWSALGATVFGPLLALQKLMRGVPLLVICQLVPLLCLARLLKRKATPRERILSLVLALYFMHTVIAYYANGFEQERMQLKFAIVIALCNLSVVRALVQRRFREVGVMLPTGG